MPNHVPLEVLMCSALLLLGSVAAPQDAAVHEASNADPSPGPPGERPYEMAGRTEERVPLVSFDDVTGWEVEGRDAEGWLYRTEEQKLYRDHCAKLVYVGKGPNPVITVRPKTPIPVPDPWDCVNFWNYGNNWGWAPDRATPPLQVAVVIRDATGRELEIALGGMDYTYWFLMHGQLPKPEQGALQRPAQLAGLRFRNGMNAEPRAVYLGPCYLYKEDLQPLSFDPWPEKLPFPTRADTILPTNRTTGFRNAAAQDGASAVFTYRGDDCEVVYRYAPTTGTLGDIELTHGGRTIRPFAGGGLCLAADGGPVEPTSDKLTRELLAAEMRDGAFVARWRLSAGGVAAQVEYRLRIKQKSLIVDIESDAGVAERVSLGRAEGVGAAKLFRIPYLTFGYGATDPQALYADGLFLFAQFDHHCSDASVLYGGNERGDGWAVFNGGARYIPKTDGQRNPVRERLFLTASPDFQEVLPTIPNPPSPFREDQGRRLWRVKMDVSHADEIAEARHLRSYGCEYVTIRYHENSWRDAGESFTFRTEAAPKAGGDAALRAMVSTVQSLGWRVGLYTNYTDYAPVNAHWNEDWVSRLPDGNWQRAWMRCYAPKPMIAVQMEALLAPQIHAKFGENHSYCDVHTAVTPFDRVDYDARVPGAGMFRRVFECFGRLLYNEKTAHNGPVYSEGLNHWWYAGLTDGNYAQLVSGSPPSVPLLVDFDLLKMHPLEMDAGMGAPGMFFRGPADLDQFIATTMAYGHIGYADWDDIHGLLRNYYMMQRIQAEYAMEPVGRIEYGSDKGMVDTSAALATDAYLRNRVHVSYRNGTEVYVNGSDDVWTVPGPHGNVDLPKWGYVGFRKAEGVLSRSALARVGGLGAQGGPVRRVDVSLADGQYYADSRGSFAFLGPIAAEGAFALKEEAAQWVAIPAPECADAAFDPALCGVPDNRDVDVTAVSEDGKELGTPPTRWSRGMLHILAGIENVRQYRISMANRPRPELATSVGTLAVLGQQVRVSLPAGCEPKGEATWEVAGSVVPAGARADGGVLACEVPGDIATDRHLWLRIPTAAGDLFVDFVTATPCATSIEPDGPTSLAPGEKLRGKLVLVSEVEEPTEPTVALNVSEGATIAPDSTRVRLPGRGRAEVPFEVTLPWRQAAHEVTASVTIGAATLALKRTLDAAVGPQVAIDLLSPDLPFTKGVCLRGGKETEGFGAEQGTFERSRGTAGGVERACFFSHPPYVGRTGYSWAAFSLTLPDKPTKLSWQMGMRDGLDATDGVTFRVLVVDEAGTETEVFAQHYSTCRWQEASADLSARAGKPIRLKLIADAGPADNTVADHALWGDIAVRTAEERLTVRWR